MRFIADLLQQTQARIGSGQAQRLWMVGEIDFFLAFRQACDRCFFDAQFAQRFESRIELAAAAIDQT